MNSERDGEMKVCVKILNPIVHFKHNKIVYYNNPAYKLDFLSLHYSFYFATVNSERDGEMEVCVKTFKSYSTL